MSGTQSQARLTEIRRLLAGERIYSEAFVMARCTVAYGREIGPRTWQRWLRKVRAEADPTELGGMSESTYLLLLTLAGLLRGNDESSRRRQVSVSRLVSAVEIVLNGNRPFDIPQVITYAELRKLAELRSLRTYSDRLHRANGLKKTQAIYTKAQAVQILSNYPDYSYVYESKAS